MKNLPQRPIKIFCGDSKFVPDPKKDPTVKPKYNLRAETAKKKPKSELGTLINVLDALYSIYRRRLEADEFGYVKCVTCPKKLHWSKMHNGHCFDRDHYIIRWEDINTGPQCKECNIDHRGEHEKYKAHINEKYGAETSDTLYRLTKVEFKLDRNLINEKINHYKRLMTKK